MAGMFGQVSKLIGGPKNNKLFCYATGNDVHWYKELGFKAFKLACPYGPSDGLAGIDKNEAFIDVFYPIHGFPGVTYRRQLCG